MKNLIVGLAVVLAGCASFPAPPRTSEEYRQQRVASTVLCSRQTVEETAAVLAKAWSKCFRGREGTLNFGGAGLNIYGSIVGGPAYVLDVQTEKSAGGTAIVVREPNRVVIALADIKATSSCPAEVSVSGGRKRGFAEQTSVWLENPDAEAPTSVMWGDMCN